MLFMAYDTILGARNANKSIRYKWRQSLEYCPVFFLVVCVRSWFCGVQGPINTLKSNLGGIYKSSSDDKKIFV